MKKIMFLTLSIIFFEIGVFTAAVVAIPIALVYFSIALICLFAWLIFGKVKPYINSPYSHMPNWFVYKRSFRVKFATVGLVIFSIIFQLNVGFNVVGKPWAGEIGVPLLSGVAVLGIIFYLIKDLLANREKKY